MSKVKKEKVIEDHSSSMQLSGFNWIAKLDNWLASKMNIILGLAVFLAAIIGLFIYDQRVSLTGDDSAYIIRAWDFVHDFMYPGFQGPLYPILISPIVLFFGVNLTLLKAFSFICVLGFIYLFHISFSKRIPALLYTVVIFLISINSYVLYYASQTYNEALFMCLQMGMFAVFFKYYVDKNVDLGLKQHWKKHLLLAIFLLLLGLTKNIGFVAFGVVLLYFFFQKQWKNILIVSALFVLLFGAFQTSKSLIWKDSGLQVEAQGSSLLYKDYYNHESGKEDLSGYENRLIENSKNYLSKHFLMMLGLRQDDPTIPSSGLNTILLYALLLTALAVVLRYNRFLLFAGMYAIVFCVIIFVILQTNWDQGRLIMPFFSLLLLLLFSLFYYAQYTKFSLLSIALPVIGVVLFLTIASRTSDHVSAAADIKTEYSGLTPDWFNYAKMSNWAGKNLPEDKVVACRKPSISFIYAKGRRFYGITRLPTYPSQDLLSALQSNTFVSNIVSGKSLSQSTLSNPYFYELNKMLWADVVVDGELYFVYRTDNAELLQKSLVNAGISSVMNVNELSSRIQNSKDEVYTLYPDSLLSTLKQNKIGYILSASLRKYSQQKTEYTINTVERYMFFIQNKYPGAFRKIVQMGKDGDEPAMIYEIVYPQ
jgi:hypothetical protein